MTMAQPRGEPRRPLLAAAAAAALLCATAPQAAAEVISHPELLRASAAGAPPAHHTAAPSDVSTAPLRTAPRRPGDRPCTPVGCPTRSHDPTASAAGFAAAVAAALWLSRRTTGLHPRR